ncbi:MAG: Gfo/Idh/MocA family oxidoreductase [Pyrinomonadaceae bacterium]|nr:Gfo/Idh/MocA family oxidoreductase [Pyrinomonadaceae bacterium]
MRDLQSIRSQAQLWKVPPETGELRVAVVGAGKMARFHLQTLNAMLGLRLVGICSPTSEKRNDLRDEFGIENAFGNAAEMFQETNPDAVFIAVSHAVTFQVSSLVLELGLPCLIEKPAAYSSGQIAELVKLANKSGCLNMVGLNRRFYSTVNQALLAVMQQGPIRGILVEAHEAILEYRSRRQFDESLYGNWMIANSVHAIDLLRMIGGEVVNIQTSKREINESRGDHFTGAIEFADGALGTFVAHWNAGSGHGMKIYGEGIVAELYPLEEGFLRYASGRVIKLHPDWTDRKFKAGLYAQDTAFLQSVCDGTRSPFPASDLKDNFKTMCLIEQIQGRN